MCPACLAAMGLYVAAGVSAGAGTTYFAGKFLRKRPDTISSTPSTQSNGDDHATTPNRIER